MAFVDEKAGFMRLPGSYVKEKKRTVPISTGLQSILNKLKAEQKRVSVFPAGSSLATGAQ